MFSLWPNHSSHELHFGKHVWYMSKPSQIASGKNLQKKKMWWCCCYPILSWICMLHDLYHKQGICFFHTSPNVISIVQCTFHTTVIKMEMNYFNRRTLIQTMYNLTAVAAAHALKFSLEYEVIISQEIYNYENLTPVWMGKCIGNW